MITRRNFIKGSMIATLPLNAFHTWKERPISPPAFSFDLHCHPGSASTYQDMKKHKLSSAFVSLVADRPLLKRTETGIIPTRSYQPGEGWKEFETQWQAIKDLMNEAEVIPISSYHDLTKTQETHNFAPFIACEGGDFLEDSTDYLELAYDRGVRSVQLVHYAPNALGDLQTYDPKHHGLSAFGKNVVKKMNDLGMIIDVAHASFETVKGVVETSTDPIILSHSLLKRRPFMPISARAITEEHAKLVATHGGVIGMWPSGLSTSIDDFADSTLRLVDMIGIDHVGIGSDMDSNYKPVIKNYTDFFQWTELLSTKGLSDTEIAKIQGGNALRVLQMVLI
ncbi:MAG: membrane dipeptidase [Saprospiraceae bacterium]|nr:membrane dipeptidase [Saprospiraceae bacterium]